MNTLTKLPPGRYFHVVLTAKTDAERECEILHALTTYQQRNGPPPEVFIFRISTLPVITDHLCLGPQP